MSKILSVSYDISLLVTRQLLFENSGWSVRSASNLDSALEFCRSERFDLVVLGHSIPDRDKALLIACARSFKTPVLALRLCNEPLFGLADYEFDVSTNPENLLAFVKEKLGQVDVSAPRKPNAEITAGEEKAS
jgi:hypothetical protein